MAREHSDYYGLVFGCPMGAEKKDCIYKSIRSKDLPDRLKYIITLSNDEHSVLEKYHRNCIARRENKVPFSRIAIL